MIEISNKCIGCGKCISVCPFAALYLDGKLAKVNENCSLCGACVQKCPVQAISITRKDVMADLSGYKGVWIFTELMDIGRADGVKQVRPVTHELLSAGRRLADELGEPLCAVLLGSNVEHLCDELASFGADKVYLVDNPELKEYNTDVYSTVLVSLINKHKPSIVLYPSTYIGRDIAPRIATELYVGLTADCTGLSIKDGHLLQTRPAFGGNIMADIMSPKTRPQMATVRPNVMKKNEPAPGVKAQVVRENVSIPADLARVKIIERIIEQTHGVEKLEEAPVVISGGRGMKDSKGFKALGALAEVLGGSVGATRAATDMGLVHKNRQIGQSGVTVCPKLYIACAISGAVQHVVGMTSSEVIIAINKDPNAPIFNVCKYGIVGDAHQILPKLTESIKKK